MKYFIFSIDDGTIYDRKVIELFNKYGVKGTFNLNSGLDNFVWYLDGKPIERLKLSECVELYKGHEVASHSLTHPHMTECSGEHIVYEVGQDVLNLEKIFNRQINTFAFPFHDVDERCIDVIKHIHNIKVIRLSLIDNSFKFPKNLHHVMMTSYNVKEAYDLVDDFIKDKNAELFTFVSHSYNFEIDDTYDVLEKLIIKIKKHKDIKIITMGELSKIKEIQ